jgi:hypothetical protein
MSESEFNESQAYLDIFKREKAIYEATPAWHVVARASLRKKVRYAYGDAIGSGSNVAMPATALTKSWAAFKRTWDNFWGDELSFWLMCLAVLLGLVVAIWWCTTWGLWDGDPPKPLPPGIQQRGYTFIIPPDYATRANYRDIKAGDLCKRLPRWESINGDDTESSSGKDGSIIIHCKMNED